MRKIGNNQKAIRFGQFAGLLIIFLNRFELVAQIFLNHILHMLGQIGQLLLNLGGVGPDAPADQGLVIVGGVHEAGEILADADGIKNGKVHPAGRQRSDQAGHNCAQGGDGLFAALSMGLQKQGTAVRKGQQGRQENRFVSIEGEFCLGEYTISQLVQIQLKGTEAHDGRIGIDGFPLPPDRIAPISLEGVIQFLQIGQHRLHAG
ncbi:MAG: hypothetical protein BWY71_01885 [Planctomycetes bacterium ADurb.Bin412]|nr:MAG: hypothetical protein BWY71_01885 [Planctomycetes bacterium ADurb.Bin412]